MPLIKENTNSTKTERSLGSFDKDSKIPQTNLNSQPASQNQKSLVNIVGSLLPFAPLVYEQFTGQKIPAMTGTLAEMQTSLTQLALTLNQVLNNQQQLWTKLENLEKGANQQFTTLGQQFQSLRLTHTKERKEIEYNPQLEN
ncbi:MAG: hypothetical protein I3270_02580 [Candidatus Moeniiplasma glomeromycotorum]|nr:hypothetical protein [Candidatus Moeniiplasma glomeromycotorum]MCE8162567.1 hypothetical protein [Candidatus Moeniiplasma glomeromycotorum]MCE8166509.1 hypothetical protein [Candidatus Moeniiplasma glomeromycotorum]MCE8166950.1 hypothetical protein [Candidatus Moeniiplasma glomeromycotorum]